MKSYGINKVLYETEIINGVLIIHVMHKNLGFRRVINLHAHEPEWFYEHYKTIATDNPRAMYWLFEIINDGNGDYFKNNKVRFVLE